MIERRLIPSLNVIKKNLTKKPLANISKFAAIGLFALTACASNTLIVPKTTIALSDNPIVMAAGDIVCDPRYPTPSGCQHAETSQIIINQNPDAVLALGDLCHYPTADCYNKAYNNSWGKFFQITYPVPGNHEYYDPGAKNYFDYWDGIGNFTGRAGDRDKGYYSFDLGSWHIVALNSECAQIGGCDQASPQYKWLEADLAKNKDKSCALAYYHKPLFSSGGQASDTMKAIFQLLYKNKVAVVLNGHDHVFEIFFLLDPNGNVDQVNGIREFVVGTGGASHIPFATLMPNSQVRDASDFGVLKLVLAPGWYNWEFIPVAPTLFSYSGSDNCH